MKVLMLFTFSLAMISSAWSQQSPAISAQTPPRTTWLRFEFDNGSIAVLLPGKPTETVERARNFGGITAQSSTYAVADGKKVVVLQVTVLTPSTETWTEKMKEDFLSGLWNGVAESFDKEMKANGSADRTALVESVSGSLGGFAAREFMFTLGEWHGYLRIALVGQRCYGVMLLDDEDSRASVEEFFKSVMIRKAASLEKRRTSAVFTSSDRART